MSLINNLIIEHILIIEKLKKQEELIYIIVKSIIETIKNGGKIIFFGNGGSLCDSQHIVTELVGKFKLNRKALPAIALTNTSVITAVGNDISFNQIFSRQVEALVTDKDLVIGISTSGNSENVIEGISAARDKGARTIALTGETGGKLANIAHITLPIPSTNTPRIQEAHILIGHIICELVEGAFLDA